MREKPAQCKVRIEGQSTVCSSPCLFKLTKPCEGSSEVELPYGIVSVQLKAATRPNNRVSIGIEVCFGDPNKMQPSISARIAGRKAKRFLDMSFGLGGESHENLGKADPTVCAREVPV